MRPRQILLDSVGVLGLEEQMYNVYAWFTLAVIAPLLG